MVVARDLIFNLRATPLAQLKNQVQLVEVKKDTNLVNNNLCCCYILQLRELIQSQVQKKKWEVAAQCFVTLLPIRLLRLLTISAADLRADFQGDMDFCPTLSQSG